MFGFYKIYFLFAILLFMLELIIAFFFHQDFVRDYGGDFIVVILLYCLVKSFINLPVLITAMCVLVFAYLVEVSQYFQLVSLLGMQNSRTAKLILGTSFSFVDLVVYTLGILLVITVEFVGNRPKYT